MQLKRRLGPEIGLSCHSSSSNTTERLTIMYAKSCQWTPSLGTWGQSTSSQSIPCRSILILKFHVPLSLFMLCQNIYSTLKPFFHIFLAHFLCISKTFRLLHISCQHHLIATRFLCSLF